MAHPAKSDPELLHRITTVSALAHEQDYHDVLDTLSVDSTRGLSKEDVSRRRALCGRNETEIRRTVSNWRILLRQLASPVVGLLAAAMALSIGLRDWPEAAAIAIVLLINTLLGYFAEQNAVRSMEALRKLDRQTARVRREGSVSVLSSIDLVPGDIVLLEAGDRVPADMRLIQASRVSANESALTGESVPVEKDIEPVSPEAAIHDRSSMLYKGTSLSSGSALAIVVATGASTELGEIAGLVQRSVSGRSPLEERLSALAVQLIWLTLGICLILGVLGLWSGQPVVQMIQATIALAVAAIPEGLPIVATLCLARGMLRMAKRNALVRSLGAVETLGATSVIMTDKTGTLTENRMTVAEYLYMDEPGSIERQPAPQSPGQLPEPLKRAMVIGTLCSNAEAGEHGASGDPLETAMFEAAISGGLTPAETRASHPRLKEVAFDPDLRLMATIHTNDGSCFAAVKGAPEAVMARATRIMIGGQCKALSEGQLDALQSQLNLMASEGYRLIALAESQVGNEDADPFADLCLVAIAALRDPPRKDVRDAVQACHQAGMRIVMVTGDHAATANAIANQIGFDQDRFGDAVFARVAPAEKLLLVSEFQSQGSIVAMTGDGVNDAPALKMADIGIAMGIRGTDVAKEAADIILTDDRFSTIVDAIREGRVIFDNIRRFCVYLLSCNLGEILLIGFAIFAGMSLPLLPLQILFLNLLTDVFPAFALATGEGDPQIAKRPPRPAEEPILGQRQWIMVGIQGTLIAAAAFVAFWLSQTTGDATGNEPATIAFLTIGFAQLLFVFAIRDPASHLLYNQIAMSPWVWSAIIFCAVLMVAATYWPAVGDVLSLTPPSRANWILIGICAVVPMIVVQVGLILWQFAHRTAKEVEIRPLS